MRENSDEGTGEAIVVEVRLSDEGLARRINYWVETSLAFVAGAAHGPRSVLVADHVPDDVSVPVVLLAEEDDLPASGDGRIAARFRPEVDFAKLHIAIEAAALGLAVSEPGHKRPSQPQHPHLTVREIEVLQRLAEGASNKAIARQLGISAHTVKFHVTAILEKLGATSRTEAVISAVRQGLLMV